MIIREPINRVPLKLSEVREPIIIESDDWFPVYKFEGIYDIQMSGAIRKHKTGEYLKTYECKTGFVVCMIHPNGDGSVLCANLCDVWSSTFLDDKALDKYSYVDSIR